MSLVVPGTRAIRRVKSFVTLKLLCRGCVADLRAGEAAVVVNTLVEGLVNIGFAIRPVVSPIELGAAGAWPFAKYRLRLKLYVVVLASVPPTFANHCVPATVFGPIAKMLSK